MTILTCIARFGPINRLNSTIANETIINKLPVDGRGRSRNGRVDGMSNERRKLGEIVWELRVDLVSNGSRGVLEFIGGVPTRHNVVCVDLRERHIRRQFVLELIQPLEVDAKWREVAYHRSYVVVPHEYGQLFGRFAKHHEERDVELI
jgi:hypothetical protein